MEISRNRRYILVALRITFGIMFLYSGIDKILNDFTAAGFLTNATAGPFADLYNQLAGNVFVDNLVIWGEILIGIALVTGSLVRFASYMGAIMMLLFYLATLPPEHGFISEHIIYILVFAVIAIFGAGRYFGLDQYIEKSLFVEGHKNLRFIFG